MGKGAEKECVPSSSCFSTVIRSTGAWSEFSGARWVLLEPKWSKISNFTKISTNINFLAPTTNFPPPEDLLELSTCGTHEFYTLTKYETPISPPTYFDRWEMGELEPRFGDKLRYSLAKSRDIQGFRCSRNFWIRRSGDSKLGGCEDL